MTTPTFRWLMRPSRLGRSRRVALEPRVVLVEVQVHNTGWPVALLPDDDFRFPLQGIAVLVYGAVVELLPVEEHDEVRVLLNGSRFAQVRQLRSLVLASAEL